MKIEQELVDQTKFYFLSIHRKFTALILFLLQIHVPGYTKFHLHSVRMLQAAACVHYVAGVHESEKKILMCSSGGGGGPAQKQIFFLAIFFNM